jgi:hypothetical protein
MVAMRKMMMILPCAALLFVAACKEETKLNSPRDTSIPTLSRAFLSTASVVKFVAFGGTLPDATTNKGYYLQLTDTAQLVVASCQGIVTDINSSNASITVTYKPKSIYSFVYTGVRNVAVQVNDTISSGSILGKIAADGKISFTLIKNDEVLCPGDFGPGGFNNAMQSAIARHNALNPDTIAAACVVSSLPK